MLLDARTVLLENYDEFAREIRIFDLPTVRDFVTRYETADNETDITNALTEAADRAFEVGYDAGFTTALRFIIDCVMGRKEV
jgi:hypothetical protein